VSQAEATLLAWHYQISRQLIRSSGTAPSWMLKRLRGCNVYSENCTKTVYDMKVKCSFRRTALSPRRCTHLGGRRVALKPITVLDNTNYTYMYSSSIHLEPTFYLFIL